MHVASGINEPKYLTNQLEPKKGLDDSITTEASFVLTFRTTSERAPESSMPQCVRRVHIAKRGRGHTP